MVAFRSLALFAIGCGLTYAALLFWRADSQAEPPAIETIASEVRAAREARSKTRYYYTAGDQASLDLPGGRSEVVRSVLNVQRQMRYGSYVWDEADIPDGDIWVRIDLDKQLMSVFRGGHEIGSAVILYGTDGKPTPIGEFTIQAMAKDYHSRTYDAPMPYMLRLTDDGVAIHASEVRNGSATHGCIGVPREFARLLFDQAQRGDRVFILPAGPFSAAS